jgi:hypothetical protein
MTHGTVGQGGSICGLEKKLEGFAKVQPLFTGPMLTAVDVGWNGALLLRRDCRDSEYLGYNIGFGDRMLGYSAIRGCVSWLQKFPCQVARCSLSI